MSLQEGIRPRRELRRGRWCGLGLLILASCSEHTPDPSTNDAGVADAGGPQWNTVLEGLDGTLLSIWGTSEEDIWTVGGPLGNGFEALVLRFDGTTWKRVKPSPDIHDTYWWVHGTGANDVWMAGENGRITHWDGAAFRHDTSGTTVTLFGVMAFSANDVWAVGGTPDQPTATNDVVLHFDGTSWKPEALPEKKGAALFKVWGASADDLYVVGELGIIWHRTAGTWKREGEGVATGRLTTVAGCDATHVFAVGARDLLESDGKGNWKKSDVPLVNDVNGVACAGGKAVVVGGGSLKLRRENDTWVSDFGSKPFEDLHGTWVSDTGAFWGAGGKFTAAAKQGAVRNGTVARYGTGTVPGTISP